MFIDFKIKKKYNRFGHSDRLKIYVKPSELYVNPGI